MSIDRYSYPFTAIVGQEQMKLALVLNAITPSIGGVLIRGEKGTGKSTAVRALAKLLPDQQVVEGCHFGCHPDDPDEWCLDCRERARARGLPAAARPRAGAARRRPRSGCARGPAAATDRHVGARMGRAALDRLGSSSDFVPGLDSLGN